MLPCWNYCFTWKADSVLKGLYYATGVTGTTFLEYQKVNKQAKTTLVCVIASLWSLERVLGNILRDFKNVTFNVDCSLYWVDLMVSPVQYFILPCDKQ